MLTYNGGSTLTSQYYVRGANFDVQRMTYKVRCCCVRRAKYKNKRALLSIICILCCYLQVAVIIFMSQIRYDAAMSLMIVKPAETILGQ